MSNANERQVGGNHYKSHGNATLQHWDIVDAFKLDYFQGQITKYVMRWRDKNGLEDLQKAAHFLQKYIELNTPSDVCLELGPDDSFPPELDGTDAVKTYHVGEVNVTGWAQFVYEGGDHEGALYKCRTCRAKFRAPFDQNPHDYHGCHVIPDLLRETLLGTTRATDEGDATPAYVNQE